MTDKIINIKPQININNDNFKKIIHLNSYLVNTTCIILVVINILIINYFFKQEIIFIYNILAKNNKSQEDINEQQQITNKLNNIFNSKLYCNEDNILYINYNNTDIKAKALNGDDIDKCSDIIKST